MASDRVLQAMSNVTLSLHVLFESADPESFWAPYLGTYNNSSFAMCTCINL